MGPPKKKSRVRGTMNGRVIMWSRDWKRFWPMSKGCKSTAGGSPLTVDEICDVFVFGKWKGTKQKSPEISWG